MTNSIERARQMREIIREVVREELDSVDPPTRVARVISVDTATRTAMVIYLGEDTAVRMPYLGTTPAGLDQEVIIGGSVHDRHIIDVKGDSGVERDLVDYKKEREVAHVQLYQSSRLTQRTGAWRDIPFNNQYLDPYNIDIASPGVIQVVIPGMYRFSSRTALDVEGGFLEARLLVTRASSGGSANVSQARLDTNARIVVPMVNEAFLPMLRGDTMKVQTYQASGIFGDGDYFLSGRGDNTFLATREAPLPS